ncbi:MAG: anti-sigma factor [Anaerolineae bacterium]|nr:anti-sigma factor [Anaerolineae bacterium]MDW8300165.1 anti-sigma factor [Anaerolineae bacterium]
MDEQELEERIATYALNILSETERAEVEAILARSAEAQELLRRYETLLGGLAALAPHRSAPEGAAERFRARLAAERTRKRPKLPLRLIFSAIAAALFILITGVLLMARAPEDEIAILLNDPRAVRVELVPQGALQGSVRFIALPNSDQGVLVAELPPLAADRQYQLWLIVSESDIRSGGVLEDTRPLRVRLPDPRLAYTLGITIEPRGGSPQPTGAPLFLGTLPPLR